MESNKSEPVQSGEKKSKLSFLQVLLIIAGVIWGITLFGTAIKLPDIPALTKDEIRSVIIKDTITVPDLEINKGMFVKGVQIAEVSNSTVELVKKGEELFKVNCASCHGDKGMGDGAAGAMLSPKPRNFHTSHGWINGKNVASLFKTLAEGIPGSGMSAYEFIPVLDRFALIYYLRTFANDFPVVSGDEIKQIDMVYGITQDTKSGAQIPIKTAEQNLIKEHKSNINQIVDLLEKSDNPASKLFCSIADCKEKAIRTLYNNSDWQNDPQSFLMLLTSNPKYSGFKASAARLSRTQIDELQVYLKSILLQGSNS